MEAGRAVDSESRGRVFVSHASEDAAVAQRLCADLEAAGISCWIAPRDIEPGRDWASEIMAGLGACRLMVLVVSERAQASAQVTRELERADAHKLPIIPFRIDGVSLTDRWEYFLSGVHWLDAQTGALEVHLSELTDVVRRALDATPREPAGQISSIGAHFAKRLLGRIALAGLPLAVLVLHQIPWPLDVTLHVETERIAFSLVGDGTVEVARGIPVASLRLRGLPVLPLAVEEVREAGKTLVGASDKEVTLKAQGPEATVTLRATDRLRVGELALAAGARLALSADRAGHLIMEVNTARGSRISVSVLGELSLDTKEYAVVGRGGTVPFPVQGPQHVLETTLLSRTLVFEPETDGPFTMILHLADDTAGIAGDGNDGMALPIAPRLKVSSLDFTRTKGARALPGIRALRVDRLGSEQVSLGVVRLEVPGETEFVLQSVRLSGDVLIWEITGRPNVLRVGKDEPSEDLVPSILEYFFRYVVT